VEKIDKMVKNLIVIFLRRSRKHCFFAARETKSNDQNSACVCEKNRGRYQNVDGIEAEKENAAARLASCNKNVNCRILFDISGDKFALILINSIFATTLVSFALRLSKIYTNVCIVGEAMRKNRRLILASADFLMLRVWH